MLKEIETEAYEGKNIKEEGLSPAMKIVGELGKYAIFDRVEPFKRKQWEGNVLSNNSKLSISEIEKNFNFYDVSVLFAYVKDTPEDELEPIREVFRKQGLEKKVR